MKTAGYLLGAMAAFAFWAIVFSVTLALVGCHGNAWGSDADARPQNGTSIDRVTGEILFAHDVTLQGDTIETSDPPRGPYTVAGSVVGLTQSGLNLTNGVETIAVPAGADVFAFKAKLVKGTSYKVTVTHQPVADTGDRTGDWSMDKVSDRSADRVDTSPPQRCSVSYSSGNVHATVTDIIVNCSSPSKFLYSWADNGDIRLSRLSGTTGVLTPLKTYDGLGLTDAAMSHNLTAKPMLLAHPFRPFIYALNSKYSADSADYTAKVGTFYADPGTGYLMPVGTPATFTGSKRTVADNIFRFAPNGKYAYSGGGDGLVAAGSSFIKRFAVGSNGSLTYLDPALRKQPASSFASSFSIDPDGRYMYVATASSIDTYTLEADGHATFLKSSATPLRPYVLDIHPDGKYLFSVLPEPDDVVHKAGSVTYASYEIDTNASVKFLKSTSATSPAYSADGRLLYNGAVSMPRLGTVAINRVTGALTGVAVPSVGDERAALAY